MKRPIDNSLVGLEHLASSTIAICGLARNCASKLKGNIKFIEALRAYFESSVVIVVENGSTDSTRQQLNQWALPKSDIYILEGELANDSWRVIPTSSVSPNPFYSRARISKMAALRNQYLEYLAGFNQSFDYVLVMDFDVNQVSLAGVLNSFTRVNEWDVITAYGYSTGPNLKERYHDTYALVPLGEESLVQTEVSIKALQSNWRLHKNDLQLREVYAAYGGLSIYKYAQIKDLRYHVMENKDSKVEVRCEHFSICHQLQQLNHTMIMVNPQMHLRYQTVWEAFKRVLSGLVQLV